MKRGRWEYDQQKPLRAFDFSFYSYVPNDNDNAFQLIQIPDFDDWNLYPSNPLAPWTFPQGQSISVYRITGEVRIDDNSSEGWNVSDHDVFGVCALVLDHKHPFNEVQYTIPKYDDVFASADEYGAIRPFFRRVTSTEINLQNADRYEVLFAEKLLLGPIVEQFDTKMPFNGTTDTYDQSSENYCGFFNWRRPIYSAPNNGSIPGEDPLFEPWRHPASKLIKRYNCEPINFGMPKEIVNYNEAKGPLRPILNPGNAVSEVDECEETSTTGTQDASRPKHGVGIRHPIILEAGSGGTQSQFLVDGEYPIPAPWFPVLGNNEYHFDGSLFGVATIGQSKLVIARDRGSTGNPTDQAQLVPVVTHVENSIHKQGLGMKIAATTQLNASKRMVGHDHDFKTIDIDCSDNPFILKQNRRAGSNAYTNRLLFGVRSDSTAGRYVDGIVLRVSLRFWYTDVPNETE